MKSNILALKYRPKNFDELVGQEAVARTLKNSLANGATHHAYLFSGLRGSGKTSSARIFAKTLLCDKAPTPLPCEECESCKMANSGSHLDIIEMDGASNRKIDDIRDLIEQTRYRPSIGRYKIFIIDEVHMLTREAFNALLKTLEEPPSYVKFILATTDPQKVPQTILSRTQHFEFKKIPDKKIENHIISILQKEGIEFEKEAISAIVRNGSGSLRDTLTLLQQAIEYSNRNITLQSVTEMLGLIDVSILETLLSAIVHKDRDAILKTLQNIDDSETEHILDEFSNFLKGKIFLGEVEDTILQRIASSIEEGKKLLFSGVDEEFTLYTTFLRMVVADTSLQTLQPQLQPASFANTPKPDRAKTDIENLFWDMVVPRVIDSNIENEKISDSDLEQCIRNTIKFEKFENSHIYFRFCFQSEKCKTILRYRYHDIRIATQLLLSEKIGKKVIFEYLKCDEVVEEKKKEEEGKKDRPLQDMEGVLEHLKSQFGEESIKELPSYE